MAEYFWPWEKDAQVEREMPDGLPLADQMAYTAMRNIYAAYRRGYLSRESAAAEKKLVRRAWEQAQKADSFEEKCRNHAIKLWREVEQTASAYQLDRTTENADRVIAAIYGVGVPQ